LSRLAKFFALAAVGGWLLAAAPFDHSVWDRVLRARVNGHGEVDYAALQRDRRDLDEYIRLLGSASPANHLEQFPTRADELAYWINAYNAFVTSAVVDNYPTASVRDIGMMFGFFRSNARTAGGKAMSLRYLENEIIRKQYREPRIHFALVRASLSCPYLAREAYTGAFLDEQLDRAARHFMGQRRNLAVDTAKNGVMLSAIFNWYKPDFEGTPPQRTLLQYIRQYTDDETRRALDALKQPRVRFYDYDWSLNSLGSREPSSFRQAP